MTKQILTALMLFAVALTYAQESIASGGGEAAGSGGSSSYTIGQLMYGSDSGGNYSASQGVQHAYEVFEISDKDELANAALGLTVYPNPTEDQLNLTMGNIDEGTMSYQLFSPSGQLLANGNLKENTTSIAMKKFAAGTYFIKVFRNDKSIRTFKIIKK